MENKILQQQQPQNSIKTLQIECQFLIKQLKQNLSKRLYRQNTQKVQKFISKQNHHLKLICASIFLKILFLQSKSVLKLIQRNTYKKYSYEQYRARMLFRIANRNNQIIKEILVEKIQSKQILDENDEGLFSFQNYQQKNQFKIQLTNVEFRKIMKTYFQIYISTVLFSLINYKMYSLNIGKWENLLQAVQEVSLIGMRISLKTQFTAIQLRLMTCKILFEKGNFEESLLIANKAIQNLLNLHYKIRVRNQQIQSNEFSYNQKLKLFKKNKHYMRKVSKLILISTVLIIRINMKAGKQNIVIEGIKIFNFIYEKIDNDLIQFRKYLNPEIYIYQQYCQYRAEKFQIQKIVQPLFIEVLNDIVNNSREKLNHNNLGFNIEKERNYMFDFFNNMMVEFRDKLGKQQKKTLLKRTAKNNIISSFTHIQNVALQQQQKINNKRNRQYKKSRQNKSKYLGFSSHGSQHSCGNSIMSKRTSTSNFMNIDKFLCDQIQKSNTAYLSSRQSGSKKLGNSQSDNYFKQSIRNSSITFDKATQFISSNLQKNPLKLANKLIGNMFTKKGMIETEKNRSLLKRNIVKGRQQKKQGQKTKQLQKGTPKNSTILQVAQSIKQNQVQIFRDIKKKIQLLKHKKNGKSAMLNKIFYNPINNQILQKKQNQNQISDSFINEQYLDLMDKHNQDSDLRNEKKLSVSSYFKNQNMNSENKNSYSNIGNKFKEKLKHLNKVTKVQLFINLLIKNKEYLGVKKWSQKIQYLKKKQELKQKLRSTRKTTSINFGSIPGLPNNLSILAGDILKYSMDQIQQFGLKTNSFDRKKMQSSQKIDNQNNYFLGQKSIQMLMNKLEKQKQNKTKTDNLIKNQSITTYHTQRNSQRKNTDSSQNKKNKPSFLTKRQNNSQWFCKFVL